MTNDTIHGRENTSRYVELTVDVVAAYVGKNVVQRSDLPVLIKEVHDALKSTAAGPAMVAEEVAKITPKVSVRKSISDNELVCMECGDKFKSLKRHLMTKHDMAPKEYRSRFNLPDDYPMVAPAYAQKRSQLARSSGLGQSRVSSRASKAA